MSSATEMPHCGKDDTQPTDTRKVISGSEPKPLENKVESPCDVAPDNYMYTWLNSAPTSCTPTSQTLARCFPGALPGSVVVSASAKILAEKFGMDAENTLYGQSICPDEINNEKGDLASLMADFWGECFPMGGIGGAPFVGKTGFKAFSHHVPEDGNVLVLFGPHIAISETGDLGKYLRVGQTEHSGACGAVLAAYAALDKGRGASKSGTMSCAIDRTDMQQCWLVNAIHERWDKIERSEEPIAELVRQAYDAVKCKLLKISNTDFGTGRLVLLGGIQINMPAPYEDHFQPLFFKAFRRGHDEGDLVSELKFTEDPSKRRGSVAMARDVLSWLSWSPVPQTPLHKTLVECFPDALPGCVVAKRVGCVLRRMDIVPGNSIFGLSICPDEINNSKGCLATLMKEDWGSCFPMGGIGGAPFVGKTGFKAFSSHVPKDGNVVILFGPHIAISAEGDLGKYLRLGQCNHSTACGALIAAYNDLSQKRGSDAKDEDDEFDVTDMQQCWIRESLEGSLETMQQAKNPYLALIHAAYRMVKSKLLSITNNDFGTGSLVLIGGIQINMPDPCQDHFEPLMFQVRAKDLSILDASSELKLGSK